MWMNFIVQGHKIILSILAKTQKENMYIEGRNSVERVFYR
jgi:hypothetical protein